MTRGQRGLLFLYCRGLSPFTLCAVSRRTSVRFFPFRERIPKSAASRNFGVRFALCSDRNSFPRADVNADRYTRVLESEPDALVKVKEFTGASDVLGFLRWTIGRQNS